jgi:hypothetical protein
VTRRELRNEAFIEISKDYPGELRKVRRSMALSLSKRRYRVSGSSLEAQAHALGA